MADVGYSHKSYIDTLIYVLLKGTITATISLDGQARLVTLP